MKMTCVVVNGPMTFNVFFMNEKGEYVKENGGWRNYFTSKQEAFEAAFRLARANNVPCEYLQGIGTHLDGSPTEDKVKMAKKYGVPVSR